MSYQANQARRATAKTRLREAQASGVESDVLTARAEYHSAIDEGEKFPPNAERVGTGDYEESGNRGVYALQNEALGQPGATGAYWTHSYEWARSKFVYGWVPLFSEPQPE